MVKKKPLSLFQSYIFSLINNVNGIVLPLGLLLGLPATNAASPRPSAELQPGMKFAPAAAASQGASVLPPAAVPTLPHPSQRLLMEPVSTPDPARLSPGTSDGTSSPRRTRRHRATTKPTTSQKNQTRRGK